MSNQLIPMSEINSMAQAIAKSGFFGMKTPEQAAALMLIAQAEGRHPAIAARDYHIIQNKPSLKADAMLARFQEAGGKIEWEKYEDMECRANFTHPCGGRVSISWTIDRGKQAGLTGNPTWQKYPRAMLRSRVISEGVRTVYPAVLCGFYTPEEVQDFDVPKPKDKEIIVECQEQNKEVEEIKPENKPITIDDIHAEIEIRVIESDYIKKLCDFYSIVDAKEYDKIENIPEKYYQKIIESLRKKPLKAS
jgi:hypothetical protein